MRWSDLSLREKETAAHSWLIYPEKAYQYFGESGSREEISELVSQLVVVWRMAHPAKMGGRGPRAAANLLRTNNALERALSVKKQLSDTEIDQIDTLILICLNRITLCAWFGSGIRVAENAASAFFQNHPLHIADAALWAPPRGRELQHIRVGGSGPSIRKLPRKRGLFVVCMEFDCLHV